MPCSIYTSKKLFLASGLLCALKKLQRSSNSYNRKQINNLLSINLILSVTFKNKYGNFKVKVLC